MALPLLTKLIRALRGEDAPTMQTPDYEPEVAPVPESVETDDDTKERHRKWGMADVIVWIVVATATLNLLLRRTWTAFGFAVFLAVAGWLLLHLFSRTPRQDAAAAPGAAWTESSYNEPAKPVPTLDDAWDVEFPEPDTPTVPAIVPRGFSTTPSRRVAKLTANQTFMFEFREHPIAVLANTMRVFRKMWDDEKERWLVILPVSLVVLGFLAHNSSLPLLGIAALVVMATPVALWQMVVRHYRRYYLTDQAFGIVEGVVNPSPKAILLAHLTTANHEIPLDRLGVQFGKLILDGRGQMDERFNDIVAVPQVEWVATQILSWLFRGAHANG